MRAARVQRADGGVVGVRASLHAPEVAEHKRPAVLVWDVVPAQIELDHTSNDDLREQRGSDPRLAAAHVVETRVR